MLDAAEHLFNGHAQHRLVGRHQMLTYLTSKGLTDVQIQLISGHTPVQEAF